jgi:hypothetical protein
MASVAGTHRLGEIVSDPSLHPRSVPTVSQIPTEVPPATASGGRRVQAQVALVLLETLRDADHPGEVLDDENVTLTIPRRLGLSGVVEAQIQRYRQEARLRGRVAEQEIVDLLRLVTRRPDSEDVFIQIGRSLTAAAQAPHWRRILPRRIAFGMARRRVVRRLKVLFGGAVVTGAGSPFVLENVDDLLIQADPGGEACGLVTGLSQAVLEAAGVDGEVHHVSCQGRRDERCRWEAEKETPSGEEEDAE